MHTTERLLADFVRATMDSLKPKSQRPQDAVSCSDCLNAVIWCMSPRNQFRSFYRYGTPDQCSPQFKDFQQCLKLKVATDDAAKEVLKSMLPKDESPTLGSIWRERPRSSPGLYPDTGVGETPPPQA